MLEYRHLLYSLKDAGYNRFLEVLDVQACQEKNTDKYPYSDCQHRGPASGQGGLYLRLPHAKRGSLK